LLRFGGFWANELNAERVPLGHYSVCMENHRGRSSHQSFPVLISGAAGFSDSQGGVLLTALEWSGNHVLRVDPASSGGHQLQAGVPLQAGEVEIPPGVSWTTPAALFARAPNGMNALRGQFARYWRQQKSGRQHARPIHFNSWEASYFTHDQHSTCALIDAAKALGAERFVLDDGWMQGRSGPGYGLGDWRPCPERYPDGLRPIGEHVRKAGLDFGLWIEPEMVTPDSEVARKYPDWLIQIPGREPISGRQQYLLNITLPEVREHLLACIDRLIEDSAPGYLKWDMNRDYAQLGFGVPPGSSAMTESWYALIKEVRRRHPDLCIESCAAGGARNDAGAMAIADRLWLSDSMDPLQRFAMLRHASLLLPPSRLGTHIGASPSATSAATLPLSTRCIVALLGHMGMELNPDRLNDEEQGTLKHWLSFYRLNREWLALADYHYLDSTEVGLDAVLLIDGNVSRGLLLVLRSQYPTQAQPPLIKLPALSDTASYQLELLNPQDCDYVQGAIPWHRGEKISISGEALRAGGLRAPYLRYGHCALISLSSLQS
jgi:alpha-galactosidase